MNSISTYTDLWLTRLDDKGKERQHTNYTYLVTCKATAHTAFYTLDGVTEWAQERGLTLPILPDGDTWNSAAIVGTYRTTAHMNEVEFYALDGALIRVLSNGQYTLGIVTIGADGIRTVHSLNPNVRTRPVFQYRTDAERFVQAPDSPMVAHYWDADGINCTSLRVEVGDLQELIYRCGWTVIHCIDNLTPAAQVEIDRLAQLPYIEGEFHNKPRDAYDWWQARVIAD